MVNQRGKINSKQVLGSSVQSSTLKSQLCLINKIKKVQEDSKKIMKGVSSSENKNSKYSKNMKSFLKYPQRHAGRKVPKNNIKTVSTSLNNL